MKLKIGDKVKINEKSATDYSYGVPSWYSTNIFTVVGFHEKDENVILLDKKLSNNHDASIHKTYLTLIRKERKNKLLKLLTI